MIRRAKFKQDWVVQPDNTKLVVQPSQVQIYNQSQFITTNWNLHKDGMYSLIKSLEHNTKSNPSLFRIDQREDIEAIVIKQISKCNYVIVRLFNQHRASYKGFISFILIGNLDRFFLIDAITLRNHLGILLQIFQNPYFYKFFFNCKQACNSLKRDFSIFPLNIFNLQFVQSQYNHLKQKGDEMRQRIYNIIYQNPEIVFLRPLKQKMNKIISDTKDALIQHMRNLPKNQLSNSESQQTYMQRLFENYQLVNHPENLNQMYTHEPGHCLSKQEVDNLKPKMQKLYYQLIKFREHFGKMHDISVQFILPGEVICKILENGNNISVLQISEMYEDSKCSNIGLQICKRIYDVIQLNQQLFQQNQKIRAELFYNQSMLKKQPVQVMSIKKLLKVINWGDSSQWLNRKDDPSLKLYKQIISIQKFDYSIGEQYIAMMDGKGLKKYQITRFLNYAELMRNKNYKKLTSYYDNNKIYKESSSKQSEFSSENEYQKRQKSEMHQIRQKQQKTHQYKSKRRTEMCPKSSTSLNDKIENEIQIILQPGILSQISTGQFLSQIQNIKEKEQNQDETRSRKSSTTNSLNLLQMDQILIKRQDIAPLPNTIQQIYELAQKVKKNVDKKTSRKKDKKVKQENKKQTEFIPTWEDIQALINTVTNINYK